MINTIQAVSFITDKKTKDLIDKIAKLGGIYCDETLKTTWYFSTHAGILMRLYIIILDF